MPAEQLVSWLRQRGVPTSTHPERTQDQQTGALRVAVATDFATGIVDVTARGVLDLSTAPVIRRAVIKAAAEEPRCIVVDLNDTVITDKRAAGVFVALAGRSTESMIGLAVQVRPGDTAELLRRMLVGWVPVREDRPDAIEALADPGQGYRRLRMHLMPVPTAPAQARRWSISRA